MGTQQGHNIARANPAKDRCSGIVVHDPITLFRILRELQLSASAFTGIHAAACAQIMHQVILAALQIPTPGLPRAGQLRQPEVNQGFLQQVISQGPIGGHFADHSRQALPG